MATGWLWEELYGWHDSRTWADFLDYPRTAFIEPQPSDESPATKRRFRSLVSVTGLEEKLTKLKARQATDDEILRVHTPEYLASLQARSAEAGGDAGGGAPFGRHGFEIAALASGGCVVAADAVLDRAVENAYVLCRPPGHHAEPNQGNGFCLLSNIGITIRHLQQVRDVKRVAVVDWDVHHGNGTETIFLGDPDVLTISLHQDGLFPRGRGAVDVVGEGDARGTNLNIPLPPGSGEGAYVYAFDRVVVPALHAFQPELIIVASGFDANAYDPLGRMCLSSESYRKLTATLMVAANALCEGRLLLCHEGGYSSFYVPFCGLATLEQLSGEATDVDFGIVMSDGMEDIPLQDHERAAVERAAQNLLLLTAARRTNGLSA